MVYLYNFHVNAMGLWHPKLEWLEPGGSGKRKNTWRGRLGSDILHYMNLTASRSEQSLLESESIRAFLFAMAPGTTATDFVLTSDNRGARQTSRFWFCNTSAICFFATAKRQTQNRKWWKWNWKERKSKTQKNEDGDWWRLTTINNVVSVKKYSYSCCVFLLGGKTYCRLIP